MANESIDKILASVYGKLEVLLDLDRFYAVLYDPRRARLEFVHPVDNGELQDVNQAPWTPRPYQGKECAPDWVIHQQGALLLETRPVPGDGDNLQAVFAEKGLAYWPDNGYPCSWLGVPLLVGKEAIGALVVENRRKAGAFGENEQYLLTTVAGQTAQAIANARLHEQLKRKIKNVSAVEEVGRQLTAAIELSEPEILELIHQQASEVMDTNNMYIALHDKESDTIRFGLYFEDGKRKSVDSRKFGEKGEGRTEWIIRNREPLLIYTGEESVAWYEEEGRHEYIDEPYASWVGVPVISGEDVLGVIATYHKTDDYVYDEEAQQVLKLMAGQAAVAIRNARLYGHIEEMVQARTAQLQAVHDIGIRITSQLDLESVLSAIVEHTNQVMSADFSTLFTYNPDRGEFETGVRRGMIEVAPSIPSATVLAAEIARTQESLFIKDAEGEPRVKPTFLEKKKIKSFAGVPLVSKKRTVGILYINFFQEHDFSAEEQNIIQLLANQAAVAIENARLVQERQEAQEQVANAEQLAAIGHVAAEFAHKMNNLAGTIPVRVGIVQDKLAESGFEDAKVASTLEGILRDAQQLLQAAQEIRRSSEIKTPEEVGVHDLIKTAIGRVRSSEPDLEGRVDIVATPMPELPQLFVERVRFLDTLESIIRNGAQAIEGQGMVTVEAKKGIHLRRPCIEIIISDTGRGIPTEDLPKVFNLFYTTKKRGLGFGLWRDRAFVRSMGGDVEVDSKVGEGTTFTVKIPLPQEAED